MKDWSEYNIPEECEQPATTGVSIEELNKMINKMSPEDQIIVLKEEIVHLGNALSRCINIVNNLQHNVEDYMHYVDMQLNSTRHAINKHTNSFHTMLIIDNKEDQKDESDIS